MHTALNAGPSENACNYSARYVNGRRASEHRASEHCVNVTVRFLCGYAYRSGRGANLAWLAYRRERGVK